MLCTLSFLMLSVIATTFMQNPSIKMALHPSVKGNLKYFGGPVISNVKVFTIFWGGSANVNFASKLEDFYGSITNSPWLTILSQYSTPTQSIGPGSWVGSFSYDAGATGLVQDSDIQKSLLRLISAGSVPAPDANTYYAIHFVPGATISFTGLTSCRDFCAYHSKIALNGSVPFIQYGVVPDQGGGCARGCKGRLGGPFDNLCSVSSHELAEAITDPAASEGSPNGPPFGWYDVVDDGEIGDVCYGQGTTLCSNGKNFFAQRLFSNFDKACVLSLGAGFQVKTTTTSTTTTTTRTLQPAPTQGSCPHSICQTGSNMIYSCDPCVAQIVRGDFFCAVTWDAHCVAKVLTVCNLQCYTQPATTTITTSTLQPAPTQGSCPHSICQTGSNMIISCDPCVAQIVKGDFFCAVTWDAHCVAKVLTVCNLQC